MKQYNPIGTLTFLLIIGVLSAGCKTRSAAEQKKLDIKLCQASLNGDLIKMKDLLARGADPNTTQCGEYAKVGYPTPLFFAILGVEREPNELLHQEGTKKYYPDDKQRLTVMALLAAGAKPNSRSNTKFQETPLMHAELLRSNGIADALKKGGADPDIRDANGRQAKDYAEFNSEELKMLISGHYIVRFAIAMADKEAAEQDIIEEVVPKK
jgi:hypothetical protein